MEIQNTRSLYGQFDFFQASFQQKTENKVNGLTGDKALQKTRYEAHLTVFTQEVQIYSKKEFKGQGESLYQASSILKMISLDINITLENRVSAPVNPGKSHFDKDEFRGVEKTADRIAKFVTKGAGPNLNRLRQGKEGIIQGFKEAEKLWGGKLPEISYETIKQALETIDKQINATGGPVFEITI